ncbi:MAG: hypothetical protein KME54_01985 [Tolypothrix brevis GSE-NOS-MK-07-07A]|nr:hypothetical protein [Tolypothrix brevis GSE-NOS-MK-07-07A]
MNYIHYLLLVNSSLPKNSSHASIDGKTWGFFLLKAKLRAIALGRIK